MLTYEKYSEWDLYKQLTELNWKGRYFSINDTTTYLTEDNKIIAVVKYDNSKSLIICVNWKIKPLVVVGQFDILGES